MIVGGDSGAASSGDFSVSSGGNVEGADWAPGQPSQPMPIDERPKINGEPVVEESHELVIKKNDAAD